MDSITQIQFGVLDGIMDDAEDVEQLYLGLHEQFTLHEVIDAVTLLLRDGMIEVKYTNDERIAPVKPINLATIHHYWFGPTAKGKAAWQQKRADYGGMTVNERLVIAGLFEQWDIAVRTRNRQRMIEILGHVALANQAESITDTTLANPKKYGY